MDGRRLLPLQPIVPLASVKVAAGWEVSCAEAAVKLFSL